MNACTNFGIIAMTIYVYLNNRVSIPYKYSVPALLCISTFGCFLTAATYRVTAGNVSFMLFICCALGGIVGALAAVIMSPFLMAYENDMISAARTGGSAMILLTALLSAAQAPGSDNRFSVSVYMAIFGILLVFPILAYYYIVRKNIRLRPQAKPEIEMSMHDSTMVKDALAGIDNPMIAAEMQRASQSADRASIRTVDITTDEESKTNNNQGNSQADGLDYDYNSSLDPEYTHVPSKTGYEKLLNDLLIAIVPKFLQKKFPWLIQAMPYMLAVAWTDFHTWGMLTAALPFAIAMTSPGDGSGNLAIAYEVGSFCLVSGDLTTTLFQIPFCYTTTLFSIGALIIYLAALNTNGFQTSAAAPFVIICYCVTQYLEAHMLTSAYRACASKFPHRYREDASRAVGIADQIGTCIGAVLSTVLISQIVAC
jgi:hypothetical protein